VQSQIAAAAGDGQVEIHCESSKMLSACFAAAVQLY